MIPEFLKKLTPYETEEEERIGEERKRSATKKAKVGCDESSEAKERLTEEVDTSDLLSDLKKNSDKGSESDSEKGGKEREKISSMSQIAILRFREEEKNSPILHREQLLVGGVSELGVSELPSLDGLESLLNLGGIDGKSSQSRESLLGLVVLPLVAEVGGRFGREGETDEEHAAPNEPEEEGRKKRIERVRFERRR